MSRFAVVLVILTILCHIINGQQPGSEGEIKCGGCPCNNPCATPSPPPPSPSPPPPALPPPSPPPPKKPSGPYCPPPPSSYPTGPVLTPPSQYIYFTGPPGNLYPVDQNFSGAAPRLAGGMLVLIGWVLLFLW